MPTFKGTKGKNININKNKNKKILDNTPIKKDLPNISLHYPDLPPQYTSLPINYTLELPLELSTLPPQKLFQIPPSQLLKTLTLSSGKNNGNNNTMKITDTIDIIFDNETGNIKEIISIMNDDSDLGYLPFKFNIPIPELIKWLKKNHIILA